MARRRDVEDRLSSLQALTDTALTHLDVDDLLAELLTRVRDILDADTAAVLLLEGSSHLVARAASGIEEEVRQGVRIPVGTGFAGRIAAIGSPVVLNRVDATTVSNPILWEKGIRVMLGVPLLSRGQTLGVLHVGRLEDRPFSAEDIDLLQIVADRVAAAFQGRSLAIERAAAALLERSLLPLTLPRCSGLQLAARYVPAEGLMVGGDWYDVFTAPSGDLWIVVGDVAGHGLAAAVVMGRIRSALRAYTLLDLPPEEVLRLVDIKVCHFEIESLATVACAVATPPFSTIRVALAGHPPPVVAIPGQPTVLASVEVDPPLGTGTPARRPAATLAIEPGTVMAFYTDGLIERRGEPIDVGFQRLCAATAAGPADLVARDIMRALVADEVPDDDIALVVLRRVGPNGA
jgi:serine phosphatase RsbU (regulator of sigma subunit)